MNPITDAMARGLDSFGCLDLFKEVKHFIEKNVLHRFRLHPNEVFTQFE